MTLRSALQGKRFGLVLSAGYFGFFGHAGFVEGLLSEGLTPSAWAGTSAGGMIAGFAAAGLSQSRVGELLINLERDDFWDPDPLGLLLDAARGGHRTTGLLRGEKFRALLEEHLPVATFEALKAPLVVVATDLSKQSPIVIRAGALASAIHATCAYPGMFQAVRRDGALLWDGGIVDKAPALALADAHPELDALLVHYLPSRDGAAEPKGPFAWPAGLASGMAALRKDHFRLQLEVLKARKVAVYVVTSNLPEVGPSKLNQGPLALDAGREAVRKALEGEPSGWLRGD